MASDVPGKCRLGFVIDVEDTVLGHQGVELLLVVGHARRERRDVPVQVGVALLAAHGQRVHSLRRHDCGHGPGNPAHDALQCQEFQFAELINPALDVPLGRDQAVAQQGGKRARNAIVSASS